MNDGEASPASRASRDASESPSSRAVERAAVGLLCAVLLIGGAGTWWLRLQPPLAVDVGPLERLPLSSGQWRGQNTPIEDEVARELAADFNLQRDYRHPAGARVWVYVGYYSTARGGRPEHTPRACYTGAGWALLETSVRGLPNGGHVEEYVVEREGRQQLVHFWYRTHRRGGLTGGLALSLDRLIGRLTTGRADGALVRLSTALRSGDDLQSARSRLDSLRRELDPQLAEHWPVEARAVAQPARSPGADPSQLRGDAPGSPG